MTDEEKKIETEKIIKELVDAYKRLSRTDDGKIVLRDLERFCGFYKTSVCEQSPNSLQTHFNEGKRRVYLHIDNYLRRESND